MSRETIETIFNADRTRQVVIFRRESGSFGFEELKFGDEEQAWFPSGCYSNSFTDSAEAALREALLRVNWLAQSER